MHRFRRRRRLSPAFVVVALAVGACGAPADEPRAPSDAEPAPQPTDGGIGRSRSPLADLATELPSARYDPAEHASRARLPTSLRIDELGVTEATVRPVGVEPNGEMEIPPADEVGWYQFGAAPGEPGSSVLAAHIAFGGRDGVFRHLDTLDTGDVVEVGFDDGGTRRYVVQELARYRKEALPPAVFSGDGDERLVLVTCGGSFNPSLRRYDSNVVAYAVPAP